MSLVSRPEWFNKQVIKKKVQAALLYTGHILWATAAVIFVAGEDRPLWQKVLAGLVIGLVLAAAIWGSWWLVYEW